MRQFRQVSRKAADEEPTMKLPTRLFLAVALLAAAPGIALAQANGPETRIKQLNITLPAPSAPIANFVPAVRAGNLLFVSGATAGADWTLRGKVGKDLTVEQGYQAARQVAINQLAVIKAALGSLDRVKRIVKVLGMVNSAEGFGDQPKVINGFSDLMVEVFGDAGRHARSAVGMAGLPGNHPVEVELIVEVE
jgi:enamine deaminase RidA (YjgF/YER057c/UK114 family)